MARRMGATTNRTPVNSVQTLRWHFPPNMLVSCCNIRSVEVSVRSGKGGHPRKVSRVALQKRRPSGASGRSQPSRGHNPTLNWDALPESSCPPPPASTSTKPVTSSASPTPRSTAPWTGASSRPPSPPRQSAGPPGRRRRATLSRDQRPDLPQARPPPSRRAASNRCCAISRTPAFGTWTTARPRPPARHSLIYLLDENVLRELRPGGNATVRAWYATVPTDALRIGAMTFFEKRRGAERMRRTDPDRAAKLLAGIAGAGGSLRPSTSPHRPPRRRRMGLSARRQGQEPVILSLGRDRAGAQPRSGHTQCP